MALFTTNAPAAKFVRIGDTVGGEIVDVYLAQRYEFVRGGYGQPLYWHNRKPTAGVRVDPATGKPNDPVMQEVITVDTGIADASGDTERRIFIKNKRMKDSLIKAVVAAGSKRQGLLLGGRLDCTFTGEEDGDGPQPAKVYEFIYTAPAAGTGREPDLSKPQLADKDSDAQPRSAVAPAPPSADVPPTGDGLAERQAVNAQKAASQAAATERIANRQSMRASVTGVPDDLDPPF